MSENKFENQDVAAQKAKILEHLKKGEGITPIDALKWFGCFRLGARIWDLKKDGYDTIHTEMVTQIDKKTGAKKKFARYWLNKPTELFE